MSTATPDRRKSKTSTELEKAHATLSEGQCNPDEAQRLVREIRERQENGGTEEFNETLASLKGRKLRLRRKRRKA
jgi:hypothetical protein